ncbi:hypothetical protein GCM10011575_38640 [Microlunatus endophyticus]|uniref:Amidohydrolase-related domain-containing protein n=1 Tax=Microlunatus endophyticus TaxID=1716077 RepID=A0A917W6Y7_9ACTN|nr:amidohydrolase family protein [Microlunatus endophyticus]GGL76789.1 hypothetical protein GCM10011575_38640 [Microlunatus endophyticus]
MTFALTHANVVNPDSGEIARDVTVLIVGDHVAAVSTQTPTGAQAIDTAGAYVVPGFNDMHAHTLELDDSDAAHQLMISYGITGYRQMSGSAALLARRAAGDFAESADAPTLLQLPGARLTNLNANSPQAVISEIRNQHEQGADFIKMTQVPSMIYRIAQAQANLLGIPCGGHLPPLTMAGDAAKAGIGFIEHLGPGLGLLILCATNEDQIRGELTALENRTPTIGLPFMNRLFNARLDWIVADSQLHNGSRMVPLINRAIDAFSEDKSRATAQILAQHNTWQCPTLIRAKPNEPSDDLLRHRDPDLATASAKARKPRHKATNKAISLSTQSTFDRLYNTRQRLTKILADEGVPMLAGSDIAGASSEVPGASLHQEFDELAAAGLSPLQILQMTTSAPAKFTGRDDIGSIEEGKRADLVLLREDPTQSVAALHTIVGLVRNGVYRGESDLNTIRKPIAHEQGAS